MRAWLAVAYWLLGGNLASAHPVAQGQLDVQWQPQAVLITARVADEQIMVASTRISRADVGTLDELWADHGRYLLAHLQLRATAAQPLRGTLLGVRRASGNFVEYRLRYTLPAHVREIRLQQDLLNEIPYAPGNPWEATYIVEPMIAGSIVAVALSNIFWPRSGGWLRLATAFFFGLFHGLGFAGALLDAAQAMSGQRIAVAITGFSTGVECGHMLVVLPLFLVLYLIRRWLPAPAAGRPDAMLALRGGSALICAAGIFYLLTALQLA